MKNLILALGIIASLQSAHAAEVVCSRALNHASQAAEEVNQSIAGKKNVSAPTLAIKGPGEIIVCVTVND